MCGLPVFHKTGKKTGKRAMVYPASCLWVYRFPYRFLAEVVSSIFCVSNDLCDAFTDFTGFTAWGNIPP